ncbi:hypothetical protein BJV77DRAFT_627390 [Russula vinacea]|nr:hypothetical protein BJV77DRAFT_627390 [Russula vinacea]
MFGTLVSIHSLFIRLSINSKIVRSLTERRSRHTKSSSHKHITSLYNLILHRHSTTPRTSSYQRPHVRHITSHSRLPTYDRSNLSYPSLLFYTDDRLILIALALLLALLIIGARLRNRTTVEDLEARFDRKLSQPLVHPLSSPLSLFRAIGSFHDLSRSASLLAY